MEENELALIALGLVVIPLVVDVQIYCFEMTCPKQLQVWSSISMFLVLGAGIVRAFWTVKVLSLFRVKFSRYEMMIFEEEFYRHTVKFLWNEKHESLR